MRVLAMNLLSFVPQKRKKKKKRKKKEKRKIHTECFFFPSRLSEQWIPFICEKQKNKKTHTKWVTTLQMNKRKEKIKHFPSWHMMSGRSLHEAAHKQSLSEGTSLELITQHATKLLNMILWGRKEKT
jgi:hypothetical protein